MGELQLDSFSVFALKDGQICVYPARFLFPFNDRRMYIFFLSLS